MIVAPLNHNTWYHGQTAFDGEAVRYEAVIFDLFGTLVDDLAGPRYSDVLRRIASAMSQLHSACPGGRVLPAVLTSTGVSVLWVIDSQVTGTYHW